jgi:hypothetical protein
MHFSPVHVICFTKLIHFDFIIHTIFGGEYKGSDVNPYELYFDVADVNTDIELFY